MGTTVSLGFPIWLDGETFNGLIGRQFEVAPSGYSTASSGGVVMRGGVMNLPAKAAVAPSSGMTVTCDGFCAIIPSSVSAAQAAYRVTSMQRQNLTLTTSDLTNPRIDLIVAGVVDNGDNTSFAYVGTVDGTPAPSPSPPSTPLNAIVLAQITVPANASSIVSGNISQSSLAFTVPPGGVLKVAPASSPAGTDGQYAYDSANDRLYHMAASGNKQARVLPFAPQIALRTADLNAPAASGDVTVASVSVTTDGSTDLEIIYKWAAVYMGTPADCLVRMAAYIDSSRVDAAYVHMKSTDSASAWYRGGCIVYRTSGAQSTTPSAGAHTVAYKITTIDAGNTSTIEAASDHPAYLAVRPVVL